MFTNRNMIKLLSTIFALIIVVNTTAQKQRKFSSNIDFHINNTLYDRTASNNGAGFGIALQGILHTSSKFSPSIEIAGDVYGGTKELYLTASGEEIYAKSGVATLMAGTLYNVTSKFNVGVMLGAGFFNDESYFAIKPQLITSYSIKK